MDEAFVADLERYLRETLHDRIYVKPFEDFSTPRRPEPLFPVQGAATERAFCVQELPTRIISRACNAAELIASHCVIRR